MDYVFKMVHTHELLYKAEKFGIMPSQYKQEQENLENFYFKPWLNKITLEEGRGQCVSGSYQNYQYGVVSNQLTDGVRGESVLGVTRPDQAEEIDPRWGWQRIF